MTVNQILNSKGKEVYSVLSTNTVFEALTIMSDKNIGAILVIEDTVLKGILSERDYARKIVLKDNAEILFLEVTNLTHEPKTVALKDYANNNNELIIDIKLSTRVTKLKEVIVEKKIPIITKKDTLVYNPDNFKDGSERVIEDLLKKLPGIKVEDNGEIKFKGKPIKKMLLDKN